MNGRCEVVLWEDSIAADSEGRLVHHPLNGPYQFRGGRDGPSYGYLTFGGEKLAESPLLSDIKVFRLEFLGEDEASLDREAWADPLRIKVLQRLSDDTRSWYLSCTGTVLDGSKWEAHLPIIQDVQEEVFRGRRPNHAVVSSRKLWHYGEGFYSRLFIEVPNIYLTDMVSRCWPRAIPGWPIEGYNLERHSVHLLREWNERLNKDDQLFRAVVDKSFVLFYTYPAEHRHFAFITNKLDLEEFRRRLDFESLTIEARNL